MANKKTKKIICIRCPRGCEVDTTIDGYEITKIKGNSCKLGIQYVEDEIKDPRRIVTTTVKVKNGEHPLVPVWTDEAIPKDKILNLADLLRKIELNAPVKIDTVVKKNIFNLGINVITSGSVEKIKQF